VLQLWAINATHLSFALTCLFAFTQPLGLLVVGVFPVGPVAGNFPVNPRRLSSFFKRVALRCKSRALLAYAASSPARPLFARHGEFKHFLGPPLFLQAQVSGVTDQWKG